MRRLHPVRGFTLLEVLVAVAVLGIALAALLRIFSSGLNNIERIDQAHLAMHHAENVMTEILTDAEVRIPVELSGDLDEGFRYTASVDHWEDPGRGLALHDTQVPAYLLQVVVDIHFKDDRRGRIYRTVSLKAVSTQPIPEQEELGAPSDVLQQLFGGRR